MLTPAAALRVQLIYICITALHESRRHRGSVLLRRKQRGESTHNVVSQPPEWAGHLAGARFALRCWLCSASADVVMRRVYGALLVAMIVVC